MLVAGVRRALLDHAMIPAGSRVLVACSGGPDSTALLLALARLAPELGFDVIAASVDHGLRGGASAEIDSVARVCAMLGVPHRRTTVDVARALDRAARTERSVQAIARTLRYRALFAIAEQHACTRIAVGHTMDDQAETVLARLLRGAGIAGLAAMRPVRADGVVRPMLGIRRVEVQAFLRSERVPSADDPSNADRRFLRVRVRRTILPRLLREDPRVVEHLAALADEAAETIAAHQKDAEILAMSCVSGSAAEGFRIDAQALAAVSPPVRSRAAGLLLLRILQRPPRRRWIDALVGLGADGGRGEIPLPGWTARRAARDGWITCERGVGPVRGSPGRASRVSGGS